jgi:diadenosine tetraphosphatase ApaH/serine/threonine PP2A family protein phosphatase
MRYAVLSDVHANLEALTAVMEALAASRIDRYLCLGDVVGYGADPSACLSRLQDCEALIVSGNHDAACIGKLEMGWFNDAAKASLLWTRDQLTFTDLDVLRRWPLKADEGSLTLVHGTLRHPGRFEYLVDVAQAVDAMSICPTLICLVGHTHLACVIEYDRTQRRLARVLTAPQELAEVTFEDHPASRRYIVNPGSVGQPRDGDPRAGYAIIDTDRKQIIVHRVPYNIEAAQRKIREAGLPAVLADRLAIGR